MPSTYYVAWSNLENLFDEEIAPASRRSEKVLRAARGRDRILSDHFPIGVRVTEDD